MLSSAPSLDSEAVTTFPLVVASRDNLLDAVTFSWLSQDRSCARATTTAGGRPSIKPMHAEAQPSAIMRGAGTHSITQLTYLRPLEFLFGSFVLRVILSPIQRLGSADLFSTTLSTPTHIFLYARACDIHITTVRPASIFATLTPGYVFRRHLSRPSGHPFSASARYSDPLNPASLHPSATFVTSKAWALTCHEQTVWVKRGLCSADSLINILLCILGYVGHLPRLSYSSHFQSL